jgi:alcohol dehydrogenase (cytochrome c)
MFYPLQNLCMKAKTTTDKRDPARVYGLSMPYEMRAEHAEHRHVHAISVETGRTIWKHEQRAGMLSLVATGGGLVFGGDAAGTFMAFDEKTGKCCGRRTSVRRSAAIRWRSRSTARNTWPSARARRWWRTRPTG